MPGTFLLGKGKLPNSFSCPRGFRSPSNLRIYWAREKEKEGMHLCLKTTCTFSGVKGPAF